MEKEIKDVNIKESVNLEELVIEEVSSNPVALRQFDQNVDN